MMDKRGLIWVCVLAAGLGMLSMGGCQKALFPENSDRTQYDRYMLLRGQERPVTEETAFGGKQPALYARLRPLSQQ